MFSFYISLESEFVNLKLGVFSITYSKGNELSLLFHHD